MATPLTPRASAPTLKDQRDALRNHWLAPEETLAPHLLSIADIGDAARARAKAAAARFVEAARSNSARSGLIDKFLQEYGLSTAEGVTLMRLAEALLRTPDAATADALIRDKVEAGDWSAHRGRSPFPLVNFSTNALMLTATWLDEVEGNDPAHKMIKATKSLLDRVGEPVIRASVAQAMKIMGEHFVLGETIGEAMRRGERFARTGYSFSFDMLGEAAHTASDAQRFFDDYQNAIASIAEHCTHGETKKNPGISVKLSALHPRYESTQKTRVREELGPRLRTLALAAKDANMGFNIDAEESERLDLSLDLIEMLMRDPALGDWQGFGVVVQAYQRRATFVLNWLATLARETGRRIMVRLVKGAYWDGEIKRAQTLGLESYPVFTRKVMTDLSYLACARLLLQHTDVFYPQFATHNALTATTVQEMANMHADGPYTDYELQRLHGMGEQLHDTLLDQGVHSRIYAPVGGHRELLPYLVRRLLENGANSSFVNQLIDPDIAIDDIVAAPVAEVRSLDEIANPLLRHPRDLYGEEHKSDNQSGGRLAAKGLDIHDILSEQTFTTRQRTSLQNTEAMPLTVRPVVGTTPQPLFNPAQPADQIGTVHMANVAAIDAVMADAAAGAKTWAEVPIDRRAMMLRDAADALEDEMIGFMRLCVFEAGKSWDDAIAEVREAVDFCRYYAGEAADMNAETGVTARPRGVIVCISPWNFPLAIFLGQVTAALVTGNAVVAKPAEQTPLIAHAAVSLLHRCGIPASALQLVPGEGETIGQALVNHPLTNGVIFTGSTPVAQTINRTLTASEKSNPLLIAETGGINAMIIDSTALLEQAVSDVVTSAFQSAGQRCSACRLVCVQEDIAPRFEAMLTGAIAELTLGNPADLTSDVGPVIDDEAARIINAYREAAKKEGTLLAVSPRMAPSAQGERFIPPTVVRIDDITTLGGEVFGPVLHYTRFAARDLDGLLDNINDLGYGLTMGLHSRIDETMHRVAARARVGNLYVNRNQIGAVVGVQPFGGERLSGTGPKAGGPHYLRALTIRSAPPSDAHEKNNLTFAAAPMTTVEREALAALDTAFTRWHGLDQVDALLADAAIFADVPASILAKARQDREALFGAVTTLPGPTGESNTLRLKPRGVILCLGHDTEHHLFSIMTALAAGNCVLAGQSPRTDALAKRLEKGLQARRLPTIMRTLCMATLTETLLLAPAIAAVAYDGNAKTQKLIRTALARAQGAVRPVISANEPTSFAVERTLTINTTAAGGDVRLLSLEA
ncbi:MAG: bifunctional proline dehydrogenase/L-glutamate gamma-semialdehyde dehydrogenase PutA [Pseudomonadota bacterium]